MIRHTLVRALALALCLGLLGGCTMLRTGYKQLDTFAVWTADEYFDFEPQQKHEFLTRFDRLHEWHRYEQLPEYAAFFGAVRARVQKRFTREDYLWVAAGVHQRYRIIANRSADDAAAMLLTVTPQQLDALQRQWDKVNRRFVREYRLEDGVEDQREARAKRLLKRIRDWVGNLGDEQERIATSMANTKEIPLAFYRLRHEDRLRRQREFLQLMTQRDDPTQFTAKLRHWLLNWEENRNPEYSRMYKEWDRKQGDIYAALDRTLTPQQRAYAVQRLQNFIEDFISLSERPGPQPAASR